jgi:hypothetical protein
MSVTTTDNPTTTQLQHVLGDYEICLTGAEASVRAAPASMTTISVQNPVDWPKNYRRVPPYRPSGWTKLLSANCRLIIGDIPDILVT